MRRHEPSVHGELDNSNGEQPRHLRPAPTLGALIARYTRAGRLADDMIDRPWTERPLDFLSSPGLVIFRGPRAKSARAPQDDRAGKGSSTHERREAAGNR